LHAHSRTRAHAPEASVSAGEEGSGMLLPQLRQNLYYCASTASNLSTCFWQGAWCVGVGVGEEVAACAACVCLCLSVRYTWVPWCRYLLLLLTMFDRSLGVSVSVCVFCLPVTVSVSVYAWL
jgi:hypothetical protein